MTGNILVLVGLVALFVAAQDIDREQDFLNDLDSKEETTLDEIETELDSDIATLEDMNEDIDYLLEDVDERTEEVEETI
jgi:peptidoglycan hydrolase CwlO-like protein